MGNERSQEASEEPEPEPEPEYMLILHANNDVEEVPGKEGIDYECAEHALLLQIREWYTDSPSFLLSIDKQPPEGDFQASVNWETEILQMSFKLPDGYPGGRVDLLRRVRQLLNGGNQLGFGITHYWAGAEGFLRFTRSMKIACKKLKTTAWPEEDWGTEICLYDCTSAWRKKTENSNAIHFKFCANDDERVAFTVDSNRYDLWNPCDYIRTMVLPVRIWLQVRYWRDKYHRAQKEKKAKIETIFATAAQELTTSKPAWGVEGLKELMAQGPAQEVTSQDAKIHEKQREVKGADAEQVGDDKQIKSGNTLEKEQSGEAVNNVKNLDANFKKERTRAWNTSQRQSKKYNQKQRKWYQEQKAKRRAERQAEPHLECQNPHEVSDDDKHTSTHPHHITGVESPHNSPSSTSSSKPQSSTASAVFHTPTQSPLLPSTPDSRIQSLNVCDFPTEETESPSHPDTREPDSADTLSENIPSHPETHEPDPVDTLPQNIPLPEETPGDILYEDILQPEDTSHSKPPEDTPHEVSQISSRPERVSLCPIPELSSVLACEPPDSHDSIPESVSPVDDTKSDSDSSESTIKAFTPPVVSLHPPPIVRLPPAPDDEMRGPNFERNKGWRQLRKKEKEREIRKETPEPSQTQEAHIKKEETRQQDVTVQDPAATDAPSQHDSQMTLADSASNPASNPAASVSKKSAKEDKGKARLSDIPEMLDSALGSLDINQPSPAAVSVEGLSSDAGQETPRPTPRARRSSLSDLSQAESASWAPVSKAATRPGDGMSPTPVICATTPSLRTVVGAGHTAEGQMPYATPTMTPGPQAEVPVGVPLQGGVAVTPAAIDHRSAHSPTHAQASTSSSLETVVAPAKSQFFYDLTYHTFPCALPGCDKRCHYYDGQTINCPACGPFSTVVYCGKDHMLDDVMWHWAYCGGCSLQRPSKLNSVPDRISLGPPMIPGISGNNPERHRQAMMFSSRRNEGDYFIFANTDQLNSYQLPPGFDGRCSSGAYCAVQMDNAVEKDRFRRVLAVCLMSSVQNTYLVCYLFRLIRDRLRATGQWCQYVDDLLRYQFGRELAVQVNPMGVGERHACETEWDGRSPRFCRDPVCKSERVTFLGDNGVSRGFARLCEDWESNYWILRANRTTHPTVKSVNARIRGEGYDLVEEDRRLFRRGEGWDGFQSGSMEIEEKWC